jgi:hypothetical protein
MNSPDVAATSREVVVSMLDGQQLRGRVQALNTQKASVQIRLIGATDSVGNPIDREVRFEQVKLIGILRRPGAAESSYPPTTRVVTIRCVDGKFIRGMTETHGAAQTGMFVVPLTSTNLERVYIPLTAIQEVLSIEKLGDILVAQGLASPQMIDKAKERQQEVKAEPLGEILVRNQTITREQLSRGLALQNDYKGTKRIGEILLEQNFVDQSQIDEAIEVQKTQRRKRFGEILIDMGFATPKMIAVALAMQCNVPFIDLGSQAFHPQLATILPAAVARRWQVMPVSTQQGTLTIAVSDPIEHPGLDEIRKLTGLTVLMVLATPQDITKSIGEYYGKSPR